LAKPAAARRVDAARRNALAKPPKTPPHSDLDGVREDRRDNVDAATETGEDAGNLGLAPADSPGKPVPKPDRGGGDDRSL
jgi:hypothetical protein